MDYAIALIVYFASILGILYCIGGLITFGNDKVMVRFCSLLSTAFAVTMYIGSTMINAIN